MENTNVTEQSTNEIMPMAASGETNFASLTEKTTPASGDMFLMEDSEDTKKINYDKLADAILNKLTSKTYSGLETTAKNFVTAINELNSNKAESINNYLDAGGQSIFDVIKATGTPIGIYAYTNIDDIPESSDPKANYIRIIKMREAMVILKNGYALYAASASAGQWVQVWYKFSGTTVS